MVAHGVVRPRARHRCQPVRFTARHLPGVLPRRARSLRRAAGGGRPASASRVGALGGAMDGAKPADAAVGHAAGESSEPRAERPQLELLRAQINRELGGDIAALSRP